MPNRVGNPAAGTRPEVVRLGTQGSEQAAPSAQSENSPAAVSSSTQNQAQQLREQQDAARQLGEGQQPGNLIDVTGG